MKPAVVLTTINPKEKTAIPDYEKKCRDLGWDFIVVGDKKTPDIALEYGYYLSAENQEKLPFGKKLPWNCYERKNVGYLYAARILGSDCIISTDDDNYPLENWHTIVDYFDKKPDLYIDNPHGLFINILEPFNQTKEQIWPRGISPFYDKVEAYKSNRVNNANVAVIAGLWDGSPDFDGLGHLYFDHIDWKFKENLSVLKNRNKFSPYNTQNTVFKTDVLLHQFLCPGIARTVDIWTSYIAQRCFVKCKKDVVYISPTVKQLRNEHNTIKDLVDERKIFIETTSFISTLRKVDISKDYFSENEFFYECCYAVRHLMPDMFMEWVDEWMEDLNK